VSEISDEMACIYLIYPLYSTEETENFASNFASGVRPGAIFCLSGELGAGKTVFTRGLCRGLGYAGRVTSPTFTLMNIYEGGRLTVYHFDLYRLAGAADLESIGCEEYFDAGGVCVLEWPQRAQGSVLAGRGVTWVEIRADFDRDMHFREITISENTSH